MIGIFDSGLGGLTGVKALRETDCGEEIVYFGDTGRVPYGTRSAETIIKYAKQDAAFLVSKGVNAILVACGTVSTIALDTLRSQYLIPIIGVVEPASKAAVAATKNRKIAVIGTAATIRSGAYERTIKQLDPECDVISGACPILVPLVENGFVAPDCEITRLACEHYLKEIKESGADTLIMGCTHYPIIASIIGGVLPNVTLISAGYEAALETVRVLGINKKGKAKISCYVSDAPAMFEEAAAMFLGTSDFPPAVKVDIEKY